MYPQYTYYYPHYLQTKRSYWHMDPPGIARYMRTRLLRFPSSILCLFEVLQKPGPGLLCKMTPMLKEGFLLPHYYQTCLSRAVVIVGCGEVQQSYAPPPPPMAPPSPSTNSSSQSAVEQLSKTNLYIRGLPPGTTDQDLIKLCQPCLLVKDELLIFESMHSQKSLQSERICKYETYAQLCTQMMNAVSDKTAALVAN
ncbi:hypothetical protein QTP70_007368 [Hemibagrus guttatus]|uniref:Uncharacterized protein n=1 Tax=Hemibagrus guttatus TaxID=175788 RepID=A0AAE0VBE7_9TELE|nr:hypothetical protein QTP70_007368 [Hemibagrus guttatus]